MYNLSTKINIYILYTVYIARVPRYTGLRIYLYIFAIIAVGAMAFIVR